MFKVAWEDPAEPDKVSVVTRDCIVLATSNIYITQVSNGFFKGSFMIFSYGLTSIHSIFKSFYDLVMVYHGSCISNGELHMKILFFFLSVLGL